MRRRLSRARSFAWALLLIFGVWRASRRHGLPFLPLLASVQEQMEIQIAALEEEIHRARYLAARAADVN